MKLRRDEKSVSARREVVIQNPLGLHARPAAEFARRANAFRSEIWVVKDGRRYAANSLLEIMRANFECGASALIEAEGPDAEAAVERLAQVVRDFRD